jgi:hypothetical protein
MMALYATVSMEFIDFCNRLALSAHCEVIFCLCKLGDLFAEVTWLQVFTSLPCKVLQGLP